MHQRLREDKSALNDVLQRLRASGARIGVREVDACMPCRGGADELLEANRRMLEQLSPDSHGERVFDSEIQGPVALHPSAEVRASVVRGPVAIGPGARISNAYIGPYTSIGAGVELDCVEIEHSIVLDGAQIRYLEARVEGSVIGPGARVMRDFRMPRALRLSVGEGSHVSFSWLGRAPARGRRRALELAQVRLERPAPAMVQPVDRVLRLPESLRDLAGREPDHVAEHDDRALVLGQRSKRLPDHLGVVRGRPVERARPGCAPPRPAWARGGGGGRGRRCARGAAART